MHFIAGVSLNPYRCFCSDTPAIITYSIPTILNSRMLPAFDSEGYENSFKF